MQCNGFRPIQEHPLKLINLQCLLSNKLVSSERVSIYQESQFLEKMGIVSNFSESNYSQDIQQTLNFIF